MASIKAVERQIGNLEGFDVVVRHPESGRNRRAIRSRERGEP